MHWLYLNSSFQNPVVYRMHRGQMGIVDGLQACGETVDIAFWHEALGQLAPEVILASVWGHDIEMALTQSQALVLPYVPPESEGTWHTLFSAFPGRIPFVVGMAESPVTVARYATIGLSYRCLPFGSTAMGIEPGWESLRFAWVFAGGRGHRNDWDRWMGALLRRDEQERLGGWWLHVPRSLQDGRVMDWGELMTRVYPVANCCPNVHCPEQKQPGIRQDANQRLFDLAAVGACQVVDWFPLIDAYFADDEVVKARGPEEWVEQVLYYATHQAAGDSFRVKAKRRFDQEHTWLHRAKQLLAWMKRG